MKPEIETPPCKECGRGKGHSIGCKTGNDQARRYQSRLQNNPRTKEAMLDEILNYDKCDLCEDHHA